MDAGQYIRNWQTADKGLKQAQGIMKRLLKTPIGEFYAKLEVRERYWQATSLVAWFERQNAVQRELQ